MAKAQLQGGTWSTDMARSGRLWIGFILLHIFLKYAETHDGRIQLQARLLKCCRSYIDWE